MVGYWNFDGDVLDHSGNGNDGTLNGASYVDGKYGQGLSFATDDYVLVADSASVDYSNTAFSFCVWVNVSSVVGGDIILSRVGARNQIYFQSDSWVRFRLNNGTDTFCDNNTLSDLVGNWHFFVFTWDKSFMRVYVDGFLGSSVVSLNAPLLALGDLYFGRTNDGFQYFNGVMDDVRLYNRSLSQAEITALFLNPHVVTVSGDAHTTVSPSGYNSVNYGDGLSVSFLPEFGYYVDKVVVDGYVIGSTGSPYVFSNVTEAHTFGVISKPVAGNELSIASWGSILLMFLVVLCVVLMVVNVGWLVRFVVGVVSFSVVALILSTGGLPFSPYFELLGLLVSVLLMLVAAVKR